MEQVPSYLQWGLLQISVPNLFVVGLMVLTFVLALLVPYPRSKEGQP
jgi:hypothetical protein